MSESVETWRYWIHLPGLVMAAHGNQPIADGTLRALNHEEWVALDQTVWQPTDYSDCRPVFYCGEVDGRRDDVIDVVVERRKLLHWALAMTCNGPLLPAASLSCSYIKSDRESRCETFLIGASGRHWILTGHYCGPRYNVDRALIRATDVTFAHLKYLEPTMSETPIEVALHALSFAALPDTYECLEERRRDLAFINGIAALELLLAPSLLHLHERKSITSAFSHNAAALVAREFEEVGPLARRFRQVYQVRSDIMHGRRGVDLKGESQVQAIAIGCAIFPIVLRKVLGLRSLLGSNTNLCALLSDAADNRDRFGELTAILLRAGLT